ncbi:tRNA glutamyl-Q(34) synthetase GluQRS [Candidatus Solirubrobacter pratensis]|uniref:tRNA glutamyl-Q(34) synthetase GluQRS n=1 Tax=Candidatus Solirubrobacter pratensis TaxID=1298857 RepID=UPI00048716F6|nr:tRNA glutamyl-Q(34) synthetase GluQRS [Candidatus Solirubrobacter pratensis]
MRGRFAPSPTGTLHLGNLRTAVLAWLFARSAGSEFLMRIEDLDAGRVRSRFVGAQLEDLAAIGLDWDGDAIAQSERGALYADALGRLDTYECFCTRAEIREAASAAHGPVGMYPGTCRSLTVAQRAQLRAAGRVPALRVRTDGEVVGFEDRVAGFFEGAVDDFVVRRNDGAHAYNLAVVVDDAAQGVEEVVRGADLLDSTPRQLWLARALGVPDPSYAHVPLVLGPDGRRLAKRHGDVTLREVAPADAVAWMARSLGLPPATTARELLPAFDPQALPREPAVYVDSAA